MSDPRSDRIFKRVFHEHPRSLIHLLNTFLPLEEPITSIEYMPEELHPDIDDGRLLIVDVRCRDLSGRNFIVEMQVRRSASLFQRTMLNACRIFSRQAGIGDMLENVQPVYTLCLLDHFLFPDATEWLHHFDTLSATPGTEGMGLLRFTFVELRKWMKSGNFDKQDMRHAWMRFFTKPETMLQVYTPEERQKYFEMYEAVMAWDLTRYTEAQLLRMDKEIDNYLTHQDYMQTAYRDGMDEGLKKGREEGMEIGMESGMEKGFEKGMQIGQEKGLELGVEVGRVLAVQSVMALILDIQSDGGVDDETLAERHRVTIEQVQMIRKTVTRASNA
jgi:predicted transposase/invertase (TIGR01784 family)